MSFCVSNPGQEERERRRRRKPPLLPPHPQPIDETSCIKLHSYYTLFSSHFSLLSCFLYSKSIVLADGYKYNIQCEYFLMLPLCVTYSTYRIVTIARRCIIRARFAPFLSPCVFPDEDVQYKICNNDFKM